jgi:homoserine dehydrogenase
MGQDQKMAREARLIRLGLVGFGSVGRAFAELVSRERSWILQDRGIDLVITGVTTGRSGSIVDASGVNVDLALAHARRRQLHGAQMTATEFIHRCPADVVVETLPLQPWSGQDAIAITRAALEAGQSVVSANKGPVAHAVQSLERLAASRGLFYRYESAVADGMPVFNLIRHSLPASDITSFEGILNSTSTLVIDAVARGQSIGEGIASAQALGIAEADPSYDLEGWDSAVKLAALSAAVWGQSLSLSAVKRDVVDASAGPRAAAAMRAGRRLALTATMSRDTRGAITADVRLRDHGPHHPFYALSAASLGLRITSRLLCPITISCDDPGPKDTAYGLLADILQGG